MSNYREVLYANYRSTQYAITNPEEFNSKIAENYSNDFGKLLPKNKQARILDVGCGSGFLLQFLQQQGYENVSGVDASIEQVEFAKQQGLLVIHGNGLEFLEHHKGYDLIFLTDIVEHLQKDELLEMLRHVYEALNSGGSAIVRTLNASSLYGGTGRYIDITHELSFTENSLRQIFLATGFTDILITDNRIPFGWKPKRLARWLMMKLLRFFQKLIYTIEAGVDRPRWFGKFFIVRACKPAVDE